MPLSPVFNDVSWRQRFWDRALSFGLFGGRGNKKDHQGSRRRLVARIGMDPFVTGLCREKYGVMPSSSTRRILVATHNRL
jgi:hypothetical protein